MERPTPLDHLTIGPGPLMQEEHVRNRWTKEARVKDGKGVFGWSGYGGTVELDMEQDAAMRTVVWRGTGSNMQNTPAWEGTNITFTLRPGTRDTRLEFAQTGYRDSPCDETGKGMPYPEIRDPSAA